jgi:hypothetical protein
VLIVEWPDRWVHPPENVIAVEIEMRGSDERRILVYRDSTR